jgi:nickel transport protein
MRFCEANERACLVKAAAVSVFLLFFLTMADNAVAHRATIFAWVDKDTIHTESKFSGGKRVKGGKVTVYDPDGNKLLEGSTDDRGEFSFKIPKMVPLRIVLMAGMGHMGEWTVQADEMAGAKETGAAETDVQKDVPARGLEQTSATAPPAPRADSKEIQLAVEKALDKRLGPVLKMLAESRDQGPGFRDVLGGIGYIIGLAGVGAYFLSRRRSNDPQGGEES